MSRVGGNHHRKLSLGGAQWRQRWCVRDKGEKSNKHWVHIYTRTRTHRRMYSECASAVELE